MAELDRPVKILLSGGGTLGPVTPLLALMDKIRELNPDSEFLLVGTKSGPEKDLARNRNLRFFWTIAPKFDRSRFWTWPVIAPALLIGLLQAIQLLKRERPTAIVTVGAYCSVPLALAAKLLRIQFYLHEQDVLPGLANRLMAPLASFVSTAFPETAEALGHGAKAIGLAVRSEIRFGSPQIAREIFSFSESKKTILVMGGGTGAMELNKIFAEIGEELSKRFNLLVLTGKGKMLKELERLNLGGGTFVAREFLDADLPAALALADLVVCRSGVGTIAEVLALRKPMILVPIAGSQQVVNAEAIVKRGAAKMLISPSSEGMKMEIENLFQNEEERRMLSAKAAQVVPLNATLTLAKVIVGSN